MAKEDSKPPPPPCRKLKRISICNTVVALAGLLISCYSLYVEMKKQEDVRYTAMCDISENVSCSKAFMSSYGTGFGLVQRLLGEDSKLNLPNPVFGIVHYFLYLCLGLWNSRTSATLQLGFGIAGVFMSVYLAYILYILHNICVVCVATYVVNILLCFLSAWRVRLLKQAKKKAP